MGLALVGTPGTGSTAAAGTLTIPVPAGVVDGDVMIMHIGVQGTTLPATPAGWTLLASSNLGPTGVTFVRVASSEPASYSLTVAGYSSGVIRAYSGGDGTTPINVCGAYVRTTATSTINASSITTTVNGCMIVFVGVANGTGTLTPITSPTGFGNHVEVTGSHNASASDDELQATAGATGSASATDSTTNTNTLGLLLAIAPASSGTTYNDSPSGTIQLSGSVAESQVASDSSSGTIQLSGSLVEQWGVIFNDTVSGAISLSGGVAESHSASDVVPGTISLSGSVVESQISTAPGYYDDGDEIFPSTKLEPNYAPLFPTGIPYPMGHEDVALVASVVGQATMAYAAGFGLHPEPDLYPSTSLYPELGSPPISPISVPNTPMIPSALL